MLANEDGLYRLVLSEGTYQLVFSHVAYYSEKVSVSASDSTVTQDAHLRPAPVAIPGMKVYERAYDPAQRIILEAIAHKEELLAKLKAYSFEAYSKLTVRDTTKSDTGNIMLIAESQLTSHWEHPDKYKEIVTARKQGSGVKGMEVLTAIGELANFNQNRLDFFDRQVVSPTARDALNHYNYYLIDTLFIDSRLVFRLEIEPKSQADPLLIGTIDVVDSGFAVVGVDVRFNEAFDIPFLKNLSYRVHYARFGDDLWMPVEIRFDGLAVMPIPGMPPIWFDYIVALHNFSFNAAHPRGTFDERWLELADDADDVDSAAWNAGQLIPLTTNELRGYQRLDSIAHAPTPILKKFVSLGLGAAYLLSGGNADIFHFNRVEGSYLGYATDLSRLIPRTNFRVKTGYAFSGEFWQHEYGVAYTISERREFSLGATYHDFITHRPTIVSRARDNPTLLALTDKTDPFDYFQQKGWTFSINTKLIPFTKVEITYRDVLQYSVSNVTEYSFFRERKLHRINSAISDGRLRSITAALSYDSRKLIRYKRRDHISSQPSFTNVRLTVAVASQRLLSNDFDFVRYDLWLRRQQAVRGLGTSSFYLYAGASERTLPPQAYFTVDYGADFLRGQSIIKTLNQTNFTGDRAALLHVTHDFGRIVFRKSGLPLIKDIPFGVSVFGSVFWTDFRSLAAQSGSADTHVARKPYRELGFGITRITPFDFKLYFTWQLSDYKTTKFSLGVGLP